MPSKNLKPCPNPKCDQVNIDVQFDKEQDDPLFATRHKITCRKCGYSTGWFDNFHEMVTWWNGRVRAKVKGPQ